MKKLVFLLVLSLCLSGVSAAAWALEPGAQAEAAIVSNASSKDGKSAKEKKAEKSKKTKAKEKASKTEKAKKAEKSKKSEKTKASKEAVYKYDLNENGTTLLSRIIKNCKMDIKPDDVRDIEGVSKNFKKYIKWERDEKDKKNKKDRIDYVFTVLKDFDRVELRVKLKKTSFILRFENGRVLKETEVGTEAGNTSVETPAVGDEHPADAPAAAPDEKPEGGDKEPGEQTDGQPAGDASVDDEAKTGANEPEAQVQGETDAPESAEPQEEREKTQDGSTGETVAETPGSVEGQSEGQDKVEDQGEGESQDKVEGQGEAEGQGEGQEKAEGEGQTETVGEDDTDGKTEDEDGAGDEDNEAEDGAGDEDDEAEDGAEDEDGAGDEDDEDEDGDEDEEDDEDGDEDEDDEDEDDEEDDEEDDDEDEDGEDGEFGAGGELPGEGQLDPEGREVGAITSVTSVLPAQAEAWFELDGVRTGGTLQEVLEGLAGGETVYLRSKNVILIKDAPLKLLSEITLLPDAEVFSGEKTVCLSQEDPESVEKPALLEAEDLKQLGEKADLYIWVAEADSSETEKKPDPEEETPQITVEAMDYTEAVWSCLHPMFGLSGIPEDKKDWTYAAIVYDERFIPILGGYYSPLEEGQYTLRFAMLDGIGDIISISDHYISWLDWTEPDVSIDVDEEKSYTLNIDASDALSGVDNLSLDGGKNWHALKDGETYTYTGKAKKTFPAGSILVRDVAGNVYISDEDYTVEKVDNGSGGGIGGGGSGGEKKPVPSHASGDGEEGVEYDALELEIPDEPMEQLAVGGETMPLTLLLESAQEPEAPVGKNQYFTATLTHWNGGESGEPDTLLLDAELDANLGDEFVYDWRFNGEVYRILANSGIKYIALKVGDDVAAFPTEGFTGGTKYTELKMLGVSTRRFDYTLSMKVNLKPGHVSAMTDNDFSQECDLSIRTEVENMNYELSNSPKSIMYFYNVFLGPEDMLNQPFGEYVAQG